MRISKTAAILLTILVFVCIYLIYRINTLEKRVDELNVEQPEDHEEVHLGEKMSKLFYFHKKLGASIKHNNRELSAFYLHEMDEAVEEMVEENIIDEGIPVSELLNEMLHPEIEQMETVLEKRDSAAQYEQYMTMIKTCNHCHKKANHPFIVISSPEKPLDGQDFSPIE